MDGFTYNNKHSSLFNCYYIPDEKHREYTNEDFNLQEISAEGMNGGYFFGTKASIREFELQCFFEDITKEQKRKMLMWVDRNTSGSLIFDNNPYVSYSVVPSEKVEIEIYSSETYNGETVFSGTFTIKFKCYRVYGKMSINSIDNYDNLSKKEDVLADSGILLTSIMPTQTFSNISSNTNFLIYNPGTIRTPCRIKVMGEAGTGVLIKNNSTNQFCKIVNMTDILTTTPNYKVLLDAEKGKTVRLVADTEEPAYYMHDLGYIYLNGCGDIKRDVSISYTNGSSVISSTGVFTSDMVGMYVYLNSQWRKITSVTNQNTASILGTISATGTQTTNIVQMNEISITGGGSFNLSYLVFEFEPYVK